MNETDYIDAMLAQYACLWEVTARKPGNVHRYRDFEDTTYLQFAMSAAAIAPILAVARQSTIGATIFNCVCMIGSVGRNTNLGIILLLAPLAKACIGADYRANVEQVLTQLTLDDTKHTYQAIRMVRPGGLGKVEEQDIHSEPTLPLRQAMALAADRDMIARQYANGFREVFDEGVPAIQRGIERTGYIEGGIIYAQLYLMSRYPDSLIARKRGLDEARESAQCAKRVLDLDWPHTEASRQEFAMLDDWLRAEGHSRNPGTTADLIAASLFVLLRGSPTPDVPWALPPSLLP